MRNLSRYRAQENDKQIGPSDLQWLEDGINFLGAWAKDIVFPGKKKSEITTTNDAANKPGKISKRKRKRGRKVIRVREREVEVIIED